MKPPPALQPLLHMPRRALAWLLKRLFKLCFRSVFVRQEAAFVLKHQHFSSLDLRLPVSLDYQCPLDHTQALLSFYEIFIAKNYELSFKLIPLPERWIDLGCHRGYFSLYVLSLLAKDKAKRARALLIDADPRSRLWVQHLIDVNHLETTLDYYQAAVSASPGPSVRFGLRDGMLSSEGEDFGPVEAWINVPKLSPATILERFKPPYDLLKIDIEGAESIFVDSFGPILEASRAILLEWHERPDATKAPGVPSLPNNLAQKLASYGFEPQPALQEPTLVHVNGLALYTGLMLFTKNRA